MKILIVAPNTSMFIKFRGDLTKEIIKKGHKVIVVSPEKDKTTFFSDNNIKLINFSFHRSSISIIKNFKYLFKLKKILDEEKPDKLFSYTIKPSILGSIVGKLSKVPEIYSMITGLGCIYTSQNIKFKILKFICGIGYKLSFKCCTKVIFQNNDDLLEFVKKNYLPKSKCELVNGSGVNMEEYKKADLPTNISFLMVSRIAKFKGIPEYFEAAKKVKEIYPNIKFIFVGAKDTSPISLNIQTFYDEYIKTNIIELHENSNNIYEFLRNTSVFVLPSYYREGIPRAALEALSVGRPIITTSSIGCQEVINNEKNGFLIPPQNINELFQKMIYLIEHPKKLSFMAKESNLFCKSKFDVNLVNKQMLKILNIT